MDVRVKLHVNSDLNVQNVWMSLNYEKNPTISHLINQVKKNFNVDANTVKLYLDEFWLPPWESSRILRENDCVKVLIEKDVEKAAEIDSKKQNFFDDKASSTNNFNFNSKKQNNLNKNENYLHQNIFTFGEQNNETSVDKQQGLNKNFNLNKYNSTKGKEKTKINHNKFSVGNYAHLLNEKTETKTQKPQEQAYDDNNEYWEEEESQVYMNEYDEAANYYQNDTTYSKQEKKPQQATKLSKNDLDKIAQNVNATGKNKWRNSTKPVTTKLPQHIIFESSDKSQSESSSTSDSSSSSSSSSSSDSSSSESSTNETKKSKPTEIKNKPTAKQQKLNNGTSTTTIDNNNKKVNQNKTKNSNDTNAQNNTWKPKTKEEQINMKSGALNEFKKVFNATKYNSPYTNESSKKVWQGTEENEENKKEAKLKETSVETEEVVDYEKLDPLVGSPNVDDKIAFQVLEISNNFTPEISPYKTGIVVEFDPNTDTISLKLNGNYNEVLYKPNKFTVVDEDDDCEEKEDEIKEISEIDINEKIDENIIKFDWKNLINVKLFPKP